jgi:hypothetical protein
MKGQVMLDGLKGALQTVTGNGHDITAEIERNMAEMDFTPQDAIETSPAAYTPSGTIANRFASR